MAKQQEDRRKKFWDDDEDKDRDDSSKSAKKTSAPSGTANSEDVDRKIHEARVLMEQTHQMYQNFFSGIERRMPIEKTKLLESKIAELQRTGTNITTARFKITQFIAQYTTMKELWERKLRDRERM